MSDASALPFALAVENVNSGGNVGSAIAVGDTWGAGYDSCGNAVGGVYIDGGEVINETTITVSADGGTAIADASGGDGNIASTGGSAGDGGTITSSAGNGGVANASANGGAISIGDINCGTLSDSPSTEATMDTRAPGRFSETLAISVSRRSALQAISLAGAAAALTVPLGTRGVTAAQPDTPPRDWFEPGMTHSGHGQVIIGEGPIYLSHLPMFLFDNRLGSRRGHPHHYQVILEVVFGGDGADDYLKDRQDSGAPLYTLAPSPFHMLDLVAPVPETSRLSSFTGTIFRGHFERQDFPQPFDIEPATLPNDVEVDVTRVIYGHEFSFHPAPLEHLEYILFGEGEDLFLAHRITRPPDFDQILSVRIEDHTFADEELQQGIIVAVPDRANTLSERLLGGEMASGDARAAGAGTLLASGFQIEAGPEFYLEESELHFPAVDDTEAEIDAGFGFR